MTETLSKDAAVLADFVKKWSGAQLRSTGAEVVNYSGSLYNVDGSSDDPTINNLNWRDLLISHGINGNCYVENVPAPAGTSHPDFSVGGHMTPNSNGFVEVGSVSYLMPLCSWHNHKARDGVLFELNNTELLKLNGYLEAEPAATFLARQSSSLEYAMISIVHQCDELRSRPQVQHSENKDNLFHSLASQANDPYFIMLKKEADADQVFFLIDATNLPVSR